ncbi:MAG TPA: SUF system NifU family Fe-S cluster assembly protein [Terriglobales bacterium]|nr:SUF system NifU family Fe-S cluster assembly protein [Terriglobales bacterium]
MSQLGDLYQELILDHSKRPRNFGPMPEANRAAEGFNRLCGDRLMLYLKMEGEVVREARFQGSGCAISTASASLLTEAVKGKTRAEAEALFQRFHQLVTGKGEAPADAPPLGKLAVFSGVSEYPARVKCASLAWHTLHSALEAKTVAEPVSTE